MSGQRRAALLAIAFGAAWAAIEALGGEILRGPSPYQIVFVRYLTHVALMFAVWGWREPSSLWRTGRPAYQIGRSLLMLGMPVCFVMAHETGVDHRTLMSIFWLSPLLILALARVVLREHVSRTVWLATIAACLGAISLFGLGARPPARLLVFPIGMAATFSLYVVMTRSLRSENTRVNLFYSAFFVALCLAPVMPKVWVTPTLVELLAMNGIGVVGFFALYALDRMASSAPVGPSATFFCFQPLLFVALERGLGRFSFGKRAMLGAGLVVTVGLLLWTRRPGSRFSVEVATL